MSDEEALLKAIIAHPGEDTPRLAYADWLDEYGNPDRAAFIRTQCAYTAASPTQREYPDHQEAVWFNRARCARQLRTGRPPLPDGFDHVPLTNSDCYRRGFFHGVRGAWHSAFREPTDAEVDLVCQGLAGLVTTTTARELELPRVTLPQFIRVLDAPGTDRLTSLTIGPLWRSLGDEMAEVLGTTSVLRDVQQLFLHFMVTESGVRSLAKARFERLEYFDLPGINCDPDALTELVGTNWFRSLMQVRNHGSARQVLAPLLAAYAKLPRLEHLSLAIDHPPTAATFPGPGGFLELAQLFLSGEFASRAARWLAHSRMPKLIELLIAGMKNTALHTLRRARWFKQLWMLYLHSGSLNDRAVIALTRANLSELRILHLGDNPFGKPGLLALADGARMPNLTTLNLSSKHAQPIATADLVEFATAITRPQLRNLYLDNWPLGTAGAKALAANPSLANLTSLSVNFCGIGDAGLNALVRSPYLQGLVELGASGNKLRKPVALLDPKLLPRLGQCWLRGTRISGPTAKKLTAARNWAVEFANE